MSSAPAAANLDQYEDSVSFETASGSPAPCNPTMASLFVSPLFGPAPYGNPPLFSSGVAWVDYFGIPIFVSQPFTVERIPVGGYTPLYGVVWPMPSPSQIPPGQYTLHVLLQGNGAALLPLYFVFTTVSTTTIIGPGLNADCTPTATATGSTPRAAADKPAPRVLLRRTQAMRRDSANFFGRSRGRDARYPKARICGRTICIQARAGAAWKSIPITRR